MNKIQRTYRVLALLGVAILWQHGARGQESPFTLFQKAHATGNFPKCIENGRMVTRFVDHPFLRYQLAECYSASGQLDTAIALLWDLAVKGLPFDISSSDRFALLKDHAAFDSLRKQFALNRQVVNGSRHGFFLKERLLIPEGITATRDGSVFFLGSLAQNKIVRRTKKDRASDFIKSNSDGLWAVLGLKLNPDETELWVCSASEQDSTDGYSGVFVYDTRTAKLRRKYSFTNRNDKHFFNDLAFTSPGTAYVTDSKGGRIWKIQGDSMRPAFEKRFIYPNGITYDPLTKLLYIADYTGITVYDPLADSLSPLQATVATYLSSVDGLYFYNQSLVAIQNAGNDEFRVVRFFLDSAGKQIVKAQVLQSHHPRFAIPTTGVIVKNRFYFISNSHLKQWDPTGKFVEQEKIRRAEIKVIPIKD